MEGPTSAYLRYYSIVESVFIKTTFVRGVAGNRTPSLFLVVWPSLVGSTVFMSNYLRPTTTP